MTDDVENAPIELEPIENPPPAEPGQAWAGGEDQANDLANGQGAGAEAAAEGEAIGDIAEAGADACVIPGVGDIVGGVILAADAALIVLQMMPSRSLNLYLSNKSTHTISPGGFWQKHGYKSVIPTDEKIGGGKTGVFGFQNTHWHTSGCAGVLHLKSDAFPNGHCWIAFRIPEVSADKYSSIGTTMSPDNYKSYEEYYDHVKGLHQREHTGHEGGATINIAFCKNDVADQGYTASMEFKTK